jgi:hypothetical protein
LIAEAPWVIRRTREERIARKTSAAIDARPRIPSPTRQTTASPRSTSTFAKAERASTIASRRRSSSIVSETDTSEVASRSTGVRWASKTLKIRARKPWAMSIRVETTWTRTMRRLSAIALTTNRSSGGATGRETIVVPSPPGRRALRTFTGIEVSTAGSRVAGWSTFAPK